MAKSQQTFNKKEIEKKKLQKKKEKEERKEERKANGKDQTFEEMLAYVDENGNISSTPPDPKKMRIVKSEDIQISTIKQADLPPEDLIRKGTVTFFNDSKGYGFIKDLVTQESFFVHMKGLIDPIKENNKVSFEVEMTPKGPSAIAVKLAE